MSPKHLKATILFKLLVFSFTSGQLQNDTPTCCEMFKYLLDNENKVESGIIKFNVPKIILDVDLKIETAFVFDEFPVYIEDVPKVNFIGNETNIWTLKNDTIKMIYNVSFNLERPVPNIQEVIVYPSSSIPIVICENPKEFKTVVKVNVFNLIPIPFPIYQCINIEGSCLFQNVNLNETNAIFIPKSNIPINAVLTVIFNRNSSIIKFTSNICDTFLKVYSLDASHLSIETIDQNAFFNCKQLIELNLSNNNITILPIGVFDYNSALDRLYLNNNFLTTVSGKLFWNTLNMNQLYLQNNLITDIAIKNFPVLSKLGTLNLSGNQLEYIDIDEIKRKFSGINYLCYKNNIDDENFEAIFSIGWRDNRCTKELLL